MTSANKLSHNTSEKNKLAMLTLEALLVTSPVNEFVSSDDSKMKDSEIGKMRLLERFA